MRFLPLFLILGTATVNADLTDDLKTCASLDDAESRLACFDAIGREAAATVESGEPEEPIAPPASMAPVAEPPEPAAPLESVEEFGLDAVTDREREAIERAAREDADAEAAMAEEERKALLEAEKAAAEQRKKDQIVQATITRVIRHHDQRFSVVLDNGQVWRETQGSRVRTPREGSAVELMRGRFGGYRMRIDGVPKLAWVKRTE